MEQETISIPVDPETAKRFRELSPEELEAVAFDVAVDVRRHRKGRRLSNEEFFALMDEIGKEAQARGLTPELLQEILDEK